jgi:hypothetical protein
VFREYATLHAEVREWTRQTAQAAASGGFRLNMP